MRTDVPRLRSWCQALVLKSDALNQTIFSESEGRDSCVVEMSVMKRMVQFETEDGALLEVLPVKIK